MEGSALLRLPFTRYCDLPFVFIVQFKRFHNFWIPSHYNLWWICRLWWTVMICGDDVPYLWWRGDCCGGFLGWIWWWCLYFICYFQFFKFTNILLIFFTITNFLTSLSCPSHTSQPFTYINTNSFLTKVSVPKYRTNMCEK